MAVAPVARILALEPRTVRALLHLLLREQTLLQLTIRVLVTRQTAMVHDTRLTVVLGRRFQEGPDLTQTDTYLITDGIIIKLSVCSF